MVTQLLVKSLASDSPQFLAVDNPQNLPPISFEDRDQHVRVPRFGSEDLARVAEFALRIGFRVLEFEIVDATMVRLRDPDQGVVSIALVEELTRGGAPAVVEAIHTRYPTFGIVGVALATPDDGELVLRRNGVAVAEPGVSAIDLLAKAWPTVRFS